MRDSEMVSEVFGLTWFQNLKDQGFLGNTAKRETRHEKLPSLPKIESILPRHKDFPATR